MEPAAVQVWSVDLSWPEARLGVLAAELSADERARAARFLFPADRRRYTVAHAALREILGAGLGRPPGEVALHAGPRGKPALAAPEDAWLRFNLSHSHDAALVACARECEVGADIERVREHGDLSDIVERFFSPAERREWAELPPGTRPEAFFHGWTRKEAYVKGLGEGLGHPSDAYTVPLAPARPAAILADALRPGAESRWSLHTVPAPAGYVATVAVAAPAVRLELRGWQPARRDFSSKTAGDLSLESRLDR